MGNDGGLHGKQGVRQHSSSKMSVARMGKVLVLKIISSSRFRKEIRGIQNSSCDTFVWFFVANNPKTVSLELSSIVNTRRTAQMWRNGRFRCEKDRRRIDSCVCRHQENWKKTIRRKARSPINTFYAVGVFIRDWLQSLHDKMTLVQSKGKQTDNLRRAPRQIPYEYQRSRTTISFFA